MVSIETIAQEYARMTGEELLHLASELATLTPDAKLLLEKECLKRGLMPELDVMATALTNEERRNEIERKLLVDKSKAISEKWDYAIRRKWENVPDETIHFGLQVRALKPDEASYMLEKLEEYTLGRQREAESNRYGAFVRAVCGLAIIVIGLLSLKVRVLFFIGGMLTIISVVQAAIASNRKAMYETVLKNLEPLPDAELPLTPPVA